MLWEVSGGRARFKADIRKGSVEKVGLGEKEGIQVELEEGGGCLQAREAILLDAESKGGCVSAVRG